MRKALLGVGSDRRVANGLEVEPVRIDNERAMVVWMRMWAKSGRSIIRSTGRQGLDVEGRRMGAIVHAKAQMIEHFRPPLDRHRKKFAGPVLDSRGSQT
ncbi:hypothetical protein AQ619_02620 [Caulobacter henricii]|uniref:Uncharacterized protein n=1 Tax=Caulobacter henricii TaxID=69395 RepID=A0A0P0NWT9_9CAUL|nr:hypothetical protein AQ619_02620 [Caulobacter henricii]